MSFFASPAFGQIAGAAVGSLLGGGSARRANRAAREANNMRIMPYLDMRDQLLTAYKDAGDAYTSAKDAGFYQGDTLARMDDRTRAGLDAAYNLGSTAAGDATGFMNTGRAFAGNYSDLYNRASQDMLGRATDYAASNAQPLIEAAMMDDRRRLEEQQLPGIQRGAMGSGNTNSSMSAVNQAIAERGYGDRRARTATNIMDRLTDRSLQAQQNQLANMTAANQNLAGLYDMGFGYGGRGASAMTGAGSAYQADQQARLDDDRMRFEGNRDYNFNLANAFGNLLKSTYPGGAAFGSIRSAGADPYMSMLSGAKMGAGFGGNIMEFFTQGNGGAGPMAGLGSKRGYFSM